MVEEVEIIAQQEFLEVQEELPVEVEEVKQIKQVHQEHNLHNQEIQEHTDLVILVEQEDLIL